MPKLTSARSGGNRKITQKKKRADSRFALARNVGGEKKKCGGGILNAVIEGTPDAIFVKDIEGRYIMVNSACTRFLNLPAEEILGKNDFDLYERETAEQFHEQDLRVLSTGETHVFEGVASNSAIEQIYLVSKSVYCDDRGRIIGLIGISHNITDRKKAEEQKIALFKEQQVRLIAEESNRLKDEFLAALSHELRTPMTCVLGWASLLRANDFDADIRNQALATIERNAEAQMRLIGDLLDVSRVINSHQPLKLGEIDLIAVIHAAIESVILTARTKQINLISEFENEQIKVIGDFNRLQQTVWNLLVNAIKFTPEHGQITISARRTATDCEISVCDTGQGIEPEFLPHVFQRFRQADEQTPEKHGGLGLGLAIVRHFVELHGGTVKAESAGKNKGAKFTVSLPLLANSAEINRDTKAEKNNPTKSAPKPNLSKIKILIAGQDKDVAEMLAAAFQSCGAKVLTSDSPFETLRNEKPDLIISELENEEENKDSFIKKVRRLPKTAGGRIPAIAYTAYASETARINAYLSGFQAHVSKPGTLFELMAIAASLTGRI